MATTIQDNDHQPESDPIEDVALWRLLGRGPRPGPFNPYFARRVLREVASLEAGRAVSRPANWLGAIWRAWQGQSRSAFVGAFAGVLVLAAFGAALNDWRAQPPASVATSATVAAAADPMPSSRASTASVVTEPITAQDVEVIADLDNLISREESRLWTEDTDTARF